MPKLGSDEETETFAWLLPFRHRGVVAYGGRRLDPVIHRSGQAWLSNGLHGSLLAWEQVSGGTVNSNRHGSMEAQFIRKKEQKNFDPIFCVIYDYSSHYYTMALVTRLATDLSLGERFSDLDIWIPTCQNDSKSSMTHRAYCS